MKKLIIPSEIEADVLSFLGKLTNEAVSRETKLASLDVKKSMLRKWAQKHFGFKFSERDSGETIKTVGDFIILLFRYIDEMDMFKSPCLRDFVACSKPSWAFRELSRFFPNATKFGDVLEMSDVGIAGIMMRIERHLASPNQVFQIADYGKMKNVQDLMTKVAAFSKKYIRDIISQGENEAFTVVREVAAYNYIIDKDSEIKMSDKFDHLGIDSLDFLQIECDLESLLDVPTNQNLFEDWRQVSTVADVVAAVRNHVEAA